MTAKKIEQQMYLEEERKEKYEVLEKISYLTESMGPEDKLPQDFINLKEMQKIEIGSDYSSKLSGRNDRHGKGSKKESRKGRRAKGEYKGLKQESIKITKKRFQESKKSLALMGVPIIESPGEAEAQCAELTKRVKVFAVVTDDMDSLAFGSPLLLPKFSFTGHTFEYDLEKILEHLCIKHEEVKYT